MKDFNFFNELASGNKKKTSSSTYMVGAALILVVVLGIISYFYLNEVSNQRNEKIALENKVNDVTHMRDYNEVVELSEKVSVMEKEKIEIERIHKQLLDSRMISSQLIKEISMAKPDAIAIKSINFTRDGINIEGTSITKNLIAIFEHNLRGNDRFSGPFVPMIQKSEDGSYYNFTLNFTFNYPVNTLEEEDIANGEG